MPFPSKSPVLNTALWRLPCYSSSSAQSDFCRATENAVLAPYKTISQKNRNIAHGKARINAMDST